MKKLILLGAGDSINKGIELGLWNKIKNKEIWALNSIFKYMPYIPKRLLWVDKNFFMKTAGEIQQLHKKGVELHCKRHIGYAFIGDIVKQYDIFREKEMLDGIKIKDISHIFFGGHGLVGMFSLSIAIREGYDKIYLLGYDWGSPSNDDRRTHCYQDKIEALNIYSSGAGKPGIYLNPDNSPNENIKDFEVYTRENVEIINVSPLSHIPYFEKIDYTEFFRRL